MTATTDPRGRPAGFGSLVGPGLNYQGVDQGVDFTGAGDVFALGDAIVTRIVRGGSGWSGDGAVINYRLLSGPKAGQHVYVAEDLVPATGLYVGKRLKRGDVVAHATGSGHAPGIEVGWARPSGIPLADRPPPRPANQETPQGFDFRQFIAGGSSPGAPGPSNPITAASDATAAAAKHVPGVVQAEAVGSFLGKLSDPSYLLRGLQVIAGGVLVLVGIVLLTRQVALAADVPIPTPARIPLPGTNRDIYQR